jgi:hypothetical protein
MMSISLPKPCGCALPSAAAVSSAPVNQGMYRERRHKTRSCNLFLAEVGNLVTGYRRYVKETPSIRAAVRS